MKQKVVTGTNVPSKKLQMPGMAAALLLALLLCLSACIDLDLLDRVNKQSVMVETPHVSHATCSLTDRTGRVSYAHQTPSLASVEVGRPPLTVMCWKEGYHKTYVRVDEEFVPAADRFPHLLESMTGFVKDPFKLFGSRYPQTVKLWLPPLYGESDAERRRRLGESKAWNDKLLAIKRKRLARARAMEELELILKYRKEHSSIRDPSRAALPHLTDADRAVRYFGGDAMVPELVREGDDVDPSLNNSTAEEIVDRFLEYKRKELLQGQDHKPVKRH